MISTPESRLIYIVASFDTFIILEANFKVDIVSSRCVISGQTFAIINVFEFPPIESLSKLVNLLYLYGIWSLYFSESATTTYSRNESDLLINYASNKDFPSDPVFLVLSEPAKSTKWSLDTITFSDDSTLDLISKWTVKTQCDLDDYLFNLCSAIVLFVSPSNIIAIASSSVAHFLTINPLTLTLPLVSS